MIQNIERSLCPFGDWNYWRPYKEILKKVHCSEGFRETSMFYLNHHFNLDLLKQMIKIVLSIKPWRI
jgi:hypothetical protein